MASKNTKQAKSTKAEKKAIAESRATKGAKQVKGSKAPKALRTEVDQNSVRDFAFPTRKSMKATISAAAAKRAEREAAKVAKQATAQSSQFAVGDKVARKETPDVYLGKVFEIERASDGDLIHVAELDECVHFYIETALVKFVAPVNAPRKFALEDKVARRDTPDLYVGKVSDIDLGVGLVYVDELDECTHFYYEADLVKFEKSVAKKKHAAVFEVGTEVAGLDVPTLMLGRVAITPPDVIASGHLFVDSGVGITKSPIDMLVKYEAPKMEKVGDTQVAIELEKLVKFERLPLLAPFKIFLSRGVQENFQTQSYVKVGNSSAIAVDHVVRDGDVLSILIPDSTQPAEKLRFKKSDRVFPITNSSK